MACDTQAASSDTKKPIASSDAKKASVPSSKYYTGVYLLNFPLFSCFATHYSAEKQAKQLHPLTDAMWVLPISRTVKISAYQSLCLEVHTWQKKFTRSKPT